MIESLIRLLLESTLIGIVVISFILILRFAFHFSLSAKVKYYIWIVALVALLIPIRIDIPVVSKVSEPIKQQTAETVMAFVNPPKPVSVIKPNQPVKKPTQNIKDPNKNAPNTIGQTNPDESTNTVVQGTVATTVAPISPWTIALIIWVIGALIYLVWITLGFIFFRKSLKDIRPFDDNEANDILEECKSRLKVRKNISIYLSSSISTPLLMGVFRSKILLPSSEYNENELRYILTHELIHFKRRDLWYKCLFVLTNAVHWFNPLVYFMHKKLNEDCELSCDEKLIRGLTDEERNSYGNILLDNIHRHNGYQVNMTTAMNNSKNSLKKRLNEIVNYGVHKRYVYVKSIVFVAMILVVFSLMLAACNQSFTTTNPIVNPSSPSSVIATSSPSVISTAKPIGETKNEELLVGSYKDEKGNIYEFTNNFSANWNGKKFKYIFSQMVKNNDFDIIHVTNNKNKNLFYGFEWKDSKLVIFNVIFNDDVQQFNRKDEIATLTKYIDENDFSIFPFNLSMSYDEFKKVIIDNPIISTEKVDVSEIKKEASLTEYVLTDNTLVSVWKTSEKYDAKVSVIEVSNSKYITNRGLRVGDSHNKLIKLYGTPAQIINGKYVYEDVIGYNFFHVTVKNNKVYKIRVNLVM